MFFDNFILTHQAGPLLEETHYYPFGLTMGGVSSKAAGALENDKKYNAIELNEDLGLGTYDAFYRTLDPQIGRWWQIDPKIESMEMWSPYASNFDNPIRFSDPLGDEGDDGFLRQAWQNFKDNLSSARDKIVGIVIQAGVNAHDNIENGRTLPQILAREFHENPLSAITGMGALQGAKVIAAEVSLIANDSKVTKEVGSTIQQNAAQGRAFEKEVLSDVIKQGEKDVSEQITLKANNGVKTKMDIASRTSDGTVRLRETKSSANAPLTKNQKLAHPSIEKSGATVVGKGKPGFPGGTKIPPTKVEIIRPENKQ